MYSETVTSQLKEQFGYKNPMEIPRITKITLNMGVGEAIADRKVMEHAVGDMTKIAGQKPVVIKARKSVAGFKLREGWPVGCKVTPVSYTHLTLPTMIIRCSCVWWAED